jgi:hypothetical protein
MLSHIGFAHGYYTKTKKRDGLRKVRTRRSKKRKPCSNSPQLLQRSRITCLFTPHGNGMQSTRQGPRMSPPTCPETPIAPVSRVLYESLDLLSVL